MVKVFYDTDAWRTDEGWRIQSRKLTLSFFAPLDKGWAK